MMTNRTSPCPNSTPSVFRNDLLDVPAVLKALDDEIESLNAKIYLKMMMANGNIACPNSNPPDFGNKGLFVSTPWSPYHLPNDNDVSLLPLPTAYSNWGFGQPALTMPLTRTASHGNYHYDFPLNSSLEPCSSTHFGYACSREELEQPSALANNFRHIPTTFESTSSSSSSSSDCHKAMLCETDVFNEVSPICMLTNNNDNATTRVSLCDVSPFSLNYATQLNSMLPVSSVTTANIAVSQNVSASCGVLMCNGVSSRNVVVAAETDSGFLDGDPFSADAFLNFSGDDCEISDDAAQQPVTTASLSSDNTSASNDVEMSDGNHADVGLGSLDDFDFSLMSPRQLESLMDSLGDSFFSSDVGVRVTTVNVVSENISASIDVEMSDNNVGVPVADVDPVSLYTSAGSDTQMSGDNNDNVVRAPADLSFLDDFCFRMSSPRQFESLMGSTDEDAYAFMHFNWDDYQISDDEEEAEVFLW